MRVLDTLKILEGSVLNILHEHLFIRQALFEVGLAFVQSRSKITTFRDFFMRNVTMDETESIQQSSE